MHSYINIYVYASPRQQEGWTIDGDSSRKWGCSADELVYLGSLLHSTTQSSPDVSRRNARPPAVWHESRVSYQVTTRPPSPPSLMFQFLKSYIYEALSIFRKWWCSRLGGAWCRIICQCHWKAGCPQRLCLCPPTVLDSFSDVSDSEPGDSDVCVHRHGPVLGAATP